MNVILKRMMSALILISLLALSSIALASDTPRYVTYPTENMYTVLKLNSSNGILSQVHIAIERNQARAEYYINLEPLTYSGENGRFILQKTGNMYNFILLDTVDGRVWQVQWSFNENNRIIFPIK